jgi:hypothetical protein
VRFGLLTAIRRQRCPAPSAASRRFGQPSPHSGRAIGDFAVCSSVSSWSSFPRPIGAPWIRPGGPFVTSIGRMTSWRRPSGRTTRTEIEQLALRRITADLGHDPRHPLTVTGPARADETPQAHANARTRRRGRRPWPVGPDRRRIGQQPGWILNAAHHRNGNGVGDGRMHVAFLRMDRCRSGAHPPRTGGPGPSTHVHVECGRTCAIAARRARPT